MPVEGNPGNPVKLDPWQNIVGVSWSKPNIITVTFNVSSTSSSITDLSGTPPTIQSSFSVLPSQATVTLIDSQDFIVEDGPRTNRNFARTWQVDLDQSLTTDPIKITLNVSPPEYTDGLNFGGSGSIGDNLLTGGVTAFVFNQNPDPPIDASTSYLPPAPPQHPTGVTINGASATLVFQYGDPGRPKP